jgi:hypothetical protein
MKVSHYDLIAIYVDDILVWSKEPMKLIEKLKKVYVLKGITNSEPLVCFGVPDNTLLCRYCAVKRAVPVVPIVRH